MSRIIQAFIASFLLFISVSTNAEERTFATPHVTVSLPTDLKVTWKDEDTKLNLFRYLLQSGNETKHNLQEVRVVVADIIPVDHAHFDEWQTDTLGSMIAIFADAHHIALESNAEVLNQKPSNLVLNHHKFKQVSLQFGQIHAQFLTTTHGKWAYMFTLVTDERDEVTRAQNLKRLLTVIKSANYR